MTLSSRILEGRSALVTGGGSGIGRELAMTLAEAGARVLVCGRREQQIGAVAAEIRAGGGQAEAVAMDVTSEASVERAFDAGSASGSSIEIVVNCAGVNGAGSSTTLPQSDWDNVMNTNVRGTFSVARECARRLIAAERSGSIINVGSVLALRTQKGMAAYMAAKAALHHLTRSLAIDWARHGIRVNTLAPGYFRTDLTDEYLDSPRGKAMVAAIPQRRAGELSELRGPLMLLASDASSFMTGSVLVVDGGQSIAGL